MIRVLIVDDHAVVRTGLKDILVHVFGGLLCGEAEDAKQALIQVRTQKWDLVILDITMPGRSGIDVLRDLNRVQPKLPVLVLSMHPEEHYGKRVLKAGASGYVSKAAAPEELIKAVRKALTGGRYVSSTLAERLAFDLTTEIDPLHERLSDREIEILRMIALGKTTSKIADSLHLSAATVNTYRARTLKKMNMTTSAELMRYALRNHLVD